MKSDFCYNGTVMENLTSCNLCCSNDFKLYTQKKGVKFKEIFSVVECQNCGLIFVNPRLTEEENLEVYNEAYFKGEGFDPSIDYVNSIANGNKEKEEESLSLIKKLSLFREGKNIKLLDVGCGTGYFLKTLEDEGYTDVTGFDLAEFAGDCVKKYCKSEIIIGDFSKHDFAGEQFDVITAIEVIEHVRDPLSFFKKVRQVLRKDGIFIYTTGNVDSWYSKLLKGKWPYISPEGHLFYFSPSTINMYFKKVGLNTLEFNELGKKEKKIILACEDNINYFLLNYVGGNNKNLVGFLFRLVGRLPKFVVGRLLSLLVGKYKLPFGFRKG